MRTTKNRSVAAAALLPLLWAANPPKAPAISPAQLKSITVEYLPEAAFNLGYGYDPVSFQVGARCVEGEVDDPVYQAQAATNTFDEVESTEDLYRKIGLDVSAHLKYGIFEGSNTAKLASETKVTKSRALLLAHILLGDARPYQLKSAKLTDDALDLLKTSFEDFRDRCGDYFVAGWTRGGEYIATASVDTSMESDKQSVTDSLKAGFKTIANEGKVSAEMTAEIKKALRGRDVKIYEFKRGGAGLTSGITIEMVAQNYVSFASNAASNPYPVRVLLKPYHLVENWPRDAKYRPELVYHAMSKLDQMAKDYAAYSEVVNEIDYQLDPNNWREFKVNIANFTDTLTGWRKQIADPGDGTGTALMDKIMKSVDACAKDPSTCSTPTLATPAATFKNNLPTRWKNLCDPVQISGKDVTIAGDPSLTSGTDFGDNIFKPPTITATIALSTLNGGTDLVVDGGSRYSIAGNGTTYNLSFAGLPGGLTRIAHAPDGCKFDVASLSVPTSLSVVAQENGNENVYANPVSAGLVKSVTCYWRQYYAKCSALSLNPVTIGLQHNE